MELRSKNKGTLSGSADEDTGNSEGGDDVDDDKTKTAAGAKPAAKKP